MANSGDRSSARLSQLSGGLRLAGLVSQAVPFVGALPRAEGIAAPESHLGAVAATTHTASIPPRGRIRFQRWLRLHSSRAYRERGAGSQDSQQERGNSCDAAGPHARGFTAGNMGPPAGSSASCCHVTHSGHARPPLREDSERTNGSSSSNSFRRARSPGRTKGRVFRPHHSARAATKDRGGLDAPDVAERGVGRCQQGSHRHGPAP